MDGGSDSETHHSPVGSGESISHDLKALITKELREYWNWTQVFAFRSETESRWNWALPHLQMTLKDPAGSISNGNLHCMCNKPTSVYWMHSAQRTNSNGARNQYTSMLFAAIYETWNECYDFKPNIEHMHFFANPVRVTASGPSTLRGVIDAHIAICNQAADYLHRVKNGTVKPNSKVFGSYGEAFVREYQSYFLLPLLRAIVVIIDREEDDIYGNCKEPDSTYAPGVSRSRSFAKPSISGKISLSKVAKYQTVLLARTGVEEGLSKAISLEGLRSGPHSLPVKRLDYNCGEGLDLVRVPLAVPVRFITNLEKRETLANLGLKDKDFSGASPKFTSEKSAFAHLGPQPPSSELPDLRSHNEKRADAWIDQTFAKADAVGYCNVFETCYSMKRIKDRLNREPPAQDWEEQEPFSRKWKYP